MDTTTTAGKWLVRFLTLVAIASIVMGFLLVLSVPAYGTPADKVTICHAAGQAGTTKFVEITASRNAIYGQAGHFYEDGTPRAGHEDDYEGPCEQPTTTTSPPTTTTSSSTT